MRLWPFGRRKPEQNAAPVAPPVPTYLKHYLDVQPYRDGQTQLTGELRCTCGCTAFRALNSRDDDRLYHAVCRDCGLDVLLFDANQHGWDAMICGDRVEDAQAGEAEATCAKCAEKAFGVTIFIEPTNEEEFVSCNENGLPEESWVNAYTWFAAHLTCCKCGHRIRSWADIETA